MTRAKRIELLQLLTDEVSKDKYDTQYVKGLMNQLKIQFSEDPMQLLNNILVGIHQEAPKDEEYIG